MQRSIFRNMALSLLHGLGVGGMFASAPVSNIQPHVGTRWGRNSKIRATRKAEFDRELAATATNHGLVPKHISLARKAAMGEIGLRGPRGLQSRRVSGTGRNSVFRITR
ncbi:hypothetical protein D3C87_1470540 [compost metagenome]